MPCTEAIFLTRKIKDILLLLGFFYATEQMQKWCHMHSTPLSFQEPSQAPHIYPLYVTYLLLPTVKSTTVILTPN